MNLKEILRIVSINIFQNKFKVMLTSLGIIVGAITIVLVIAIGQGGEEAIASQFKGLSAETIYVDIDYTKVVDQNKLKPLTLEHLEQMLEESRSLSGAYLRKNSYNSVTLSGKEEFLSVVGVSDNFENISNYKVKIGDTITELEVESEDHAAVIGNKVAVKYFGNESNAIGEKIKIGQQYYLITGVLERKEEGLYGVNPDESIFIPITTFDKYSEDKFLLPQIVGVAKSLKHVDKAKKEIVSTLNYILEEDNLYRAEDAGSRIDAATQSARTMKLLLISVATIVFIVGGIGIMNVLFVSVKERTKEIGILKALGSSKANILCLFLVESIMVGIFGGIVGVTAGCCILPLMKYTDIAVISTAIGPTVAFAFAVLTSTIFGFYPAYKASQLSPIQALNQE